MAKITVSGKPGTGTSTLCKLLEQRTGWPYVYAGQLFRDEAARRNLSLAAFGALCEEDATVDKALDHQQEGLLEEEEHLILEGRLSGWLAARAGADALRVQIICEENERIRRIVERDGGDSEEQRQKTLEREASEHARYQSYYDVDPNDSGHYQLVLDSTNTAPEALVDAILTALEGTS